VKDIVILGGPNGAGKTTAARALLPQELNIREFVNADEIAQGAVALQCRGRSPGCRSADARKDEHLVRDGRVSPSRRPVSGRTHLNLIRQCKVEGWRMTLLFLWLPSPQAALDRVARRVREGGHGIPADVVVRRYRAGLSNLCQLYLPWRMWRQSTIIPTRDAC